jgi:KUP system potassium uptake protein
MTKTKTTLAAMTLGAIGVVYGDIGTSPLYAFKLIFHAGLAPTSHNVLGILSLFFWTLMGVVSFKYLGLIMRADNRGEGGLMALLALASRSVGRHNAKAQKVLLLLGVFGLALFLGDGVITPAISVLGAVEGLNVLIPGANHQVVPLALLIICLLFFFQKHGTASIGRFFGPIMVLWFLTLGALGVAQISQFPGVLQALLPHYALYFMLEHYNIAFITLGTVFLCVTGAEALYADMGHFGKRPIQLAWFVLVFPCLVLNYLGQGALVLHSPQAISNPFFMMAPSWGLLPLVILATAASVIASQALISGAFSAIKQAIQMGYLPRLSILHTSTQHVGQIYIPVINWFLLVCTLAVILHFGSSGALGAAYGIAVSLVMLITTVLTFFVIRYRWHYPLWLCLLATGIFLSIDASFAASNLLKFTQGGWIPIGFALLLFTLMTTWKQGRQLMAQALRAEALALPKFLNTVFVTPPTQVPGTAVFLNTEPGNVPHALLHNLKHNKVIHQRNLFVTVSIENVPWVKKQEAIKVTPLNNNCWQILLRFGFKDDTNVPLALSQIQEYAGPLQPASTSYFLSRQVVVPTMGKGMALWREKLFAQMHKNASNAADFLRLPSNAVVELGSQVEIQGPKLS